MYGQKKANFFPRPEMSKIVTLIKSRCSLIGRENLSDITEAEVQVTRYSNERGLCYLRIRNMTYVLNVLPDKERFSIFDGGNRPYPTRGSTRKQSHGRVNGNTNYS